MTPEYAHRATDRSRSLAGWAARRGGADDGYGGNRTFRDQRPRREKTYRKCANKTWKS
ncbi:hypothetical protein GGE12_005481 [Rhizobium mongolense]|uniref:Uncharacterized protein n=1 Tax=Rhizobium mongolense TaxID=57676 RepID=A0A7W6WGN2_9HYPH|nr:hypothetical protein [Rhizobium mongolense]